MDIWKRTPQHVQFRQLFFGSKPSRLRCLVRHRGGLPFASDSNFKAVVRIHGMTIFDSWLVVDLPP